MLEKITNGEGTTLSQILNKMISEINLIEKNQNGMIDEIDYEVERIKRSISNLDDNIISYSDETIEELINDVSELKDVNISNDIIDRIYLLDSDIINFKKDISFEVEENARETDKAFEELYEVIDIKTEEVVAALETVDELTTDLNEDLELIHDELDDVVKAIGQNTMDIELIAKVLNQNVNDGLLILNKIEDIKNQINEINISGEIEDIVEEAIRESNFTSEIERLDNDIYDFNETITDTVTEILDDVLGDTVSDAICGQLDAELDERVYSIVDDILEEKVSEVISDVLNDKIIEILNDRERIVFQKDWNIIDNEIGKAIDKWKYENGLTISWSQTRNLIVIITDLIRKFK